MFLRVSSKIVQIWNWLNWKWIQSELFTQMLSLTCLTYRNLTFLELGLCLSFQTWMELKSWSLSDLIGPKSELFHKKYVITALELEVCKYHFSTCSSIFTRPHFFFDLFKIHEIEENLAEFYMCQAAKIQSVFSIMDRKVNVNCLCSSSKEN